MVIAFELVTSVNPKEAEDVQVACICTQLISSASAGSLIPRPEDRTRLLSSSPAGIVFRPAQLSVAFACVGVVRVLYSKVYDFPHTYRHFVGQQNPLLAPYQQY